VPFGPAGLLLPAPIRRTARGARAHPLPPGAPCQIWSQGRGSPPAAPRSSPPGARPRLSPGR